MSSGPIQFAGLAPDTRSVRSGGEIGRFDLSAAIRLGRALRSAMSAAQSTTAAAVALVEAINSLEHEARPANVLVRAFGLTSLDQLNAALRTYVRQQDSSVADDAACLELLASRGIEPAWNDPARSDRHRAVVVTDRAEGMAPLLARQLRVGDSARAAVSAVYVPDAPNSRELTDKTFLRAFGVQSALALSIVAWPGESLMLIGFCRAALASSIVANFETVGAYARLGWLESVQARERFSESARERLRAAALEQLLGSHEVRLADLQHDLQRRLDQANEVARQAEQARRAELEGNNRNLQRAQRAMLNVIEDLREARSALEAKVQQRTQELRAANELLASRNQDLEEFVYIASHDLQEPLRTVAGYLQMIERRYGSKLGSEGDEFIRFAIDGAHRMQSLLESLLLYSRVSTKEKVFGLVHMDDALDDALKNLALRIEQSHAVIERSALPSVRADRTQLVQLFQNLLSNSLKFSGDKPPRIFVSSTTREGWIKLSVRDEGIGFNPKYVDRIFKLFRRLRRDTPGTGIGLSVCKKIAERHGGSIEAESCPGAGSTFSVNLPASTAVEGS